MTYHGGIIPEKVIAFWNSLDPAVRAALFEYEQRRKATSNDNNAPIAADPPSCESKEKASNERKDGRCESDNKRDNVGASADPCSRLPSSSGGGGCETTSPILEEGGWVSAARGAVHARTGTLKQDKWRTSRSRSTADNVDDRGRATRKSPADGASNDGIVPLMVASAPCIYDQETDGEDEVDEVDMKPPAKPKCIKKKKVQESMDLLRHIPESESSAEGNVGAKQTSDHTALPKKHADALLSRIKKLVNMWAEEVCSSV